MPFVIVFLFTFVILTSLSHHIRPFGSKPGICMYATNVFRYEAKTWQKSEGEICLELQYNRHIYTALYVLLRSFVLTGWMLTARKSPPLPDCGILLPFTHPRGIRWHFHC